MKGLRALSFILVAVLALYVAASVESNTPPIGLLQNDPASFDGYTFFSPILYGETYLIDNNGDVVKSWDTGPGLSPYLLEDGSVIHAADIVDNPVFPWGGGTGGVQRYDWDGTLLWEYTYSGPDYHAHHDIEVLPNGNVLMIAWERKTAAEAVAAGRDPSLLSEDELHPLRLIEVEPVGATGGNIVWQWDAWDHMIQDFDATKANFGVVADHPELLDLNYASNIGPDWHHTNAVDYNADLDQIVVSVHHFGELWVIDHSTTTAEAASHSGGDSGQGGDLLYRWGNPQVYDAGDAGDQQLFRQHDAQWIESGLAGEGNILIYNNGPGRPAGNYSSIEEIVPPVDGSGSYALVPGEAYGPASPVWSYADPPNFYSHIISGTQRLPNGNTLIDEGFTGRIFEVTSAGATVWEYRNPVASTGPMMQGDPAQINPVFRAYRFAPDFPAFSGKDLTPMGPLEIMDSDKDMLSNIDETSIYGTDPFDADTDGDGCRDGAEVLLPASEGGQRDPLNPYDFYDVAGPGGGPPDGIIDLPNDILGVIQHFAPLGKEPEYDVRFDRGPRLTGPLWNMTAPDGVIDLPNDILGVFTQFGHDCT